uniref:Uncharacterized protein n=3 Tax=Caenorhabditis japonica TaxID=281687 RepID=A0A8R1HJF2_CAEJA
MKSMHTIQRVAAAVAIFNNVLWIVLIKFKSHQRLGNYKYFMIYISIFEILYAAFDALTVPVIVIVIEIYSKGSTYLVVIQADQSSLPQSLILFAAVMFCGFFGISMAIFAIHFIYRYLVVSKSQIVAKFDRQVVISLLAFPIFFGALWLWITYFFMKPFKEANEFL